MTNEELKSFLNDLGRSIRTGRVSDICQAMEHRFSVKCITRTRDKDQCPLGFINEGLGHRAFPYECLTSGVMREDRIEAIVNLVENWARKRGIEPELVQLTFWENV